MHLCLWVESELAVCTGCCPLRWSRAVTAEWDCMWDYWVSPGGLDLLLPGCFLATVCFLWCALGCWGNLMRCLFALPVTGAWHARKGEEWMMHVVLLVVAYLLCCRTRNPALSFLLSHKCFALWQKQLIPPPTVELKVSFPTQRISIVLTFAVSTSLALFPWVVSQAYPTPKPPAKLSCLLQAKRVQQELNQPCFKSPGTHPIGVLTTPLAAKYFV